MKLSISIEMFDDKSDAEIVAPIPTQHETQRRNQPFHVSGNFIAQLAATFHYDLDGRSRGHSETLGAIQRYEVASAPVSFLPGTMIHRKI
jgi:hypothetical protein